MSTQQQTISLVSVSSNLNVPMKELLGLIKQLKIKKFKNSRKRPSIFMDDYYLVRDTLQVPNKEARSQEKQAFRDTKKGVVDTIKENITIDSRSRLEYPEKVIIFAGPTNSGKTYNAVNELFRDYENNPTLVHTYAAPLRLLAYEIYNKMAEKYGYENVGFITGEEAINPEAKLLATTTEMAPKEGHSIFVDEAHWLTEPSRGHIWTRLLVSGKYKNFYISSAAEAIPIIKKLLSDAWYTDTQKYERKTPIVYEGKINLKDIQPKTAVICFSRKGVYAVAHRLQRLGKKVGVLYGALPLETRKKQIQNYLDGKYDIMVTTDVIGHGINLPIDTIVFTQTSKFDGKNNRQLYLWEAAQIAGRAGRFGLSEKGQTYMASGLDWFDCDEDFLKDAVLAAGGKIATDLKIKRAYLAPTLNDLGLDPEGGTFEARKLVTAIKIWFSESGPILKEQHLEPAKLEEIKANTLEAIHAVKGQAFPWANSKMFTEADVMTYKTQNINVLELWQLVSGPYTPENKVVNIAARWLSETDRDNSNTLDRFFHLEVAPLIRQAESVGTKGGSKLIEPLEKVAAVNNEIKMLFQMFGKERNETRMLGTLSEKKVHQAEEVINDKITSILSTSIKETVIGKCLECKKETEPWFSYCDSCFTNKRNSKHQK